MTPATRRGLWAAVLVVAVGVLAVALWPRSGPEPVGAHARRLASELRCVDCEGLSVADSRTESARVQRRDIERRIRAGESDAQIRRYYVDTFGESVLLRPAADGIGILVWALPVVAVLLGAVGLVLAIRRWQRQPRLVASEEDEALVATAREPAEPGGSVGPGEPDA